MTGRGASRAKTGRGGKRTATALASPPAGWLSRALDAQKAGRLREAEKLCRQALQSNPANPDACYLLARNLSQRGELREAAVMAARAAGGRPAEPMLEAIQRFPGRAYFCIDLANVLLKARRPEEAEDWCRRALEIEPASAEAYFNLACALRRLDRNREAWQAYRCALAHRPDYADAWAEMGTLHLSEKRHAEALACLDEALRLAAAIEVLDVAVSVDSMPAHLAGALGRPCLIPLSYVDWRWLREVRTGAWYPTACLFRQTRPQDWPAPAAELAETLRAWPAQAKPAEADMNG